MPSREEAVPCVPPLCRPLSVRERSLDAFDARLPWAALVAAVEPAGAPQDAEDGGASTETLLRHALLARFFGLDSERLLERVRDEDGPMRRFARGAGADADPPSARALERFNHRLVDADIALALLGIAERMIVEERSVAGERAPDATEPSRGAERPARTDPRKA